MKITPAKSYTKVLNKLSPAQQIQARQRLKQWVIDPRTPALRDHALRGSWEGYRSINVGGDLRLIYRYIDPQHIVVVTIGTHSQLYG